MRTRAARPGAGGGSNRLNAPKDGRFDFFSRELYTPSWRSSAALPPADLACLPHFELPRRPWLKILQTRSEYPLPADYPGLITHSTNWQGIIPTLQEATACKCTQVGIAGSRSTRTAAERWTCEDHELGVGGIALRARRRAVGAPLRWTLAECGLHAAGQGHFTAVEWGRGSQRQK